MAVNKGLVLDENSAKKLTTLQLSASDQDSEPGELVYRLTKQPGLGHLEHAAGPGDPPGLVIIIIIIIDSSLLF